MNEIFNMKKAQSPSQNETSCPICGKTGRVVGISKFQDVVKCRECKLRYLKKSIRLKAPKCDEWYKDMRDCPRSRVETFIADMKKPYLRQLSILEKLAAEKSLLDVGSGIGIFLSLAKQQGWDIYGVEENEHAFYFAERQFGIKYSKGFDNFADSSVDVIRISHVLEHIPEPHEFLAQLSRILKPNGILMVIVPNCEPLCGMIINKIRSMISKKPKFSGAVDPYGHVLGFTTKALSNFLQQFDLKEIDLFTASMGNATYFPMFYDGLLRITPFSQISFISLLRFWMPMIINNVGNSFDRGCWIVGYFRKNKDMK